MRITSILHFEGWAFLCALGGIVVYRLLTRQIVLEGLLARKTGGEGASPERVQLLLVTLALSAKYISEVVHSTSGAMPDVSRQWLIVFGASSGTYASVKAITTFWKK